ncbi:hypothetical protein GGX14DRAFT_659827 [Mycena pura]|uniref:Uncharacterized protein n=1 Tax=Mycena pura TaxID=153505 RepID=A0AAD6V4E7_9AGAR|nr:hypothetical protein GGX14DRAFT_659827 [Mycena pura]
MTAKIEGDASVSYNSERVTLAEIGVPGLSWPGLITVGPSIVLQGYISGALSISGSAKAGVSYNFKRISMSFGDAGMDPDLSDDPADPVPTQGSEFNLGYEMDLSGDFTVHLVPAVQLGLSIGGGTLLNAQAYIATDISAGVSMNGSVSSTVDNQVCISPHYGANFAAGIRGALPYWQPTPIQHVFFDKQYTVGDTCWSSTSEPTVEGLGDPDFDSDLQRRRIVASDGIIPALPSESPGGTRLKPFHTSLVLAIQAKTGSRKLQQISMQLQRSTPAALSIDLETVDLLNASGIRVADLLLTESRRWQNVYLDIHPSCYKHLTAPGIEFPILEKLTLLVYDPLPVLATLFLGSLPALMDLTLELNTSESRIPSTLDFIWAQLRTCTLTDCCTDDIQHVLPLFSAGTRVCLQNFSWKANAQLTSVHTVVSDLSLHCYEQMAIHTLLDHALTAPCLKRFSIVGPFPFSSLIAFFDRSSCVLTHLNIDHHDNANYVTDLLTLLGTPHACDIVDLGVSLRSFSLPQKLADALATREIIPNLWEDLEEYILELRKRSNKERLQIILFLLEIHPVFNKKLQRQVRRKTPTTHRPSAADSSAYAYTSTPGRRSCAPDAAAHPYVPPPMRAPACVPAATPAAHIAVFPARVAPHPRPHLRATHRAHRPPRREPSAEAYCNRRISVSRCDKPARATHPERRAHGRAAAVPPPAPRRTCLCLASPADFKAKKSKDSVCRITKAGTTHCIACLQLLIRCVRVNIRVGIMAGDFLFLLGSLLRFLLGTVDAFLALAIAFRIALLSCRRMWCGKRVPVHFLKPSGTAPMTLGLPAAMAADLSPLGMVESRDEIGTENWDNEIYSDVPQGEFVDDHIYPRDLSPRVGLPAELVTLKTCVPSTAFGFKPYDYKNTDAMWYFQLKNSGILDGDD